MEATLNPPADLLNAVREVILAKKFVDRDVERIHLKVVAVAAVVFFYMAVVSLMLLLLSDNCQHAQHSKLLHEEVDAHPCPSPQVNKPTEHPTDQLTY